MDVRVGQIITELRRRLQQIYGDRLKHILVFGSCARGEGQPGSDIDTLVVLDSPVNAAEEISRTIDDVAALSLEHDVVLSCVFAGQDDFDRGSSPLLRNARREGVPL